MNCENKNTMRQELLERYELAMERMASMCLEQCQSEACTAYFSALSQYVLQAVQLYDPRTGETVYKKELSALQQEMDHLYASLQSDAYEKSWANPHYAVSMLGEEYGQLLSCLYAQLTEIIGWCAQGKLENVTVMLELVLEIYCLFSEGMMPSGKEIKDAMYWFFSDYCDLFVRERIRESVDPSCDHAVRIIMESDLTDIRYLYRYGEYVTESEIGTARFLNSLSEDEIDKIAGTFTEGYRIGFVNGGKDLSKKKTVNIRYQLGFERIVRKAIENFRKMGLSPVIFSRALCLTNRRGTGRIGYQGANVNAQMEFDHKEDIGLFLDKKFVERRLEVTRSAYEEFKTYANTHAGPAVIETFGEAPFSPISNASAVVLNDEQRNLFVAMNNQLMQITNRYIIGEERSFTIIAFPVPQIGAAFGEIFRETVRINTLDNELWKAMQQKLIDALDQGCKVHITGRNGNRSDLTVALHPISDPGKQTIFENCVADVNIPVGEVFTSPQLEGTNGILHVTQVYLSGLDYHDLYITFKDGMIEDYGCGGFDTPQEGREYVRATVLEGHDTLPMGEFAIGTNTVAYAAAEKYNIAAQLPILIAEKTGPHFAVGDTCYSWTEDLPVYNPDGKEIIARDNSVSALRKEDPGKAYFGCHTDITIPYAQLGSITVIHSDGSEKELLRDGRFVLEGCEKLNEALDEKLNEALDT